MTLAAVTVCVDMDLLVAYISLIRRLLLNVFESACNGVGVGVGVCGVGLGVGVGVSIVESSICIYPLVNMRYVKCIK